MAGVGNLLIALSFVFQMVHVLLLTFVTFFIPIVLAVWRIFDHARLPPCLPEVAAIFVFVQIQH